MAIDQHARLGRQAAALQRARRQVIVRGQIPEGRARLTHLLGVSGTVPLSLRAEALYAAGTLALSQSDLSGARHLFEESLAIGRELHDPAGLMGPLSGLGAVAMQQGDNVLAGEALEGRPC